MCSSDLSIKDMRVQLAAERVTVQGTLETIKSLRDGVKISRKRQKELREKIREEVKFNRFLKAEARRAKAEARQAAKAARILARNQRAHDRIAKLEARIQAMRDKANAPKQVRKNQRKASVAVVYTADQIAAMNAERGLA